jgi:hypothetical protein
VEIKMARLNLLAAGTVLTGLLLINGSVSAQVEDPAQLMSMIEATMQDEDAREEALR